MGNKYSIILPADPEAPGPRLYLGPIDFVLQPSVLTELGATAVCSVLPSPPAEVSTLLKSGQIARAHLFPLDDAFLTHVNFTTGETARKALETCAFIRSCLRDGLSIIVHCDSGIQRSAAVTVFYLMLFGDGTRTSMPFLDAQKFVRARRDCINVGPFAHALVAAEEVYAGGLDPDIKAPHEDPGVFDENDFDKDPRVHILRESWVALTDIATASIRAASGSTQGQEDLLSDRSATPGVVGGGALADGAAGVASASSPAMHIDAPATKCPFSGASGSVCPFLGPRSAASSPASTRSPGAAAVGVGAIGAAAVGDAPGELQRRSAFTDANASASASKSGSGGGEMASPSGSGGLECASGRRPSQALSAAPSSFESTEADRMLTREFYTHWLSTADVPIRRMFAGVDMRVQHEKFIGQMRLMFYGNFEQHATSLAYSHAHLPITVEDLQSCYGALFETILGLAGPDWADKYAATWTWFFTTLFQALNVKLCELSGQPVVPFVPPGAAEVEESGSTSACVAEVEIGAGGGDGACDAGTDIASGSAQPPRPSQALSIDVAGVSGDLDFARYESTDPLAASHSSELLHPIQSGSRTSTGLRVGGAGLCPGLGFTATAVASRDSYVPSVAPVLDDAADGMARKRAKREQHEQASSAVAASVAGGSMESSERVAQANTAGGDATAKQSDRVGMVAGLSERGGAGEEGLGDHFFAQHIPGGMDSSSRAADSSADVATPTLSTMLGTHGTYSVGGSIALGEGHGSTVVGGGTSVGGMGHEVDASLRPSASASTPPATVAQPHLPGALLVDPSFSTAAASPPSPRAGSSPPFAGAGAGGGVGGVGAEAAASTATAAAGTSPSAVRTLRPLSRGSAAPYGTSVPSPANGGPHVPPVPSVVPSAVPSAAAVNPTPPTPPRFSQPPSPHGGHGGERTSGSTSTGTTGGTGTFSASVGSPVGVASSTPVGGAAAGFPFAAEGRLRTPPISPSLPIASLSALSGSGPGVGAVRAGGAAGDTHRLPAAHSSTRPFQSAAVGGGGAALPLAALKGVGGMGSGRSPPHSGSGARTPPPFASAFGGGGGCGVGGEGGVGGGERRASFSSGAPPLPSGVSSSFSKPLAGPSVSASRDLSALGTPPEGRSASSLPLARPLVGSVMPPPRIATAGAAGAGGAAGSGASVSSIVLASGGALGGGLASISGGLGSALGGGLSSGSGGLGGSLGGVSELSATISGEGAAGGGVTRKRDAKRPSKLTL